ncbi:flagellin, partial [Selenomonas ruminis]
MAMVVRHDTAAVMALHENDKNSNKLSKDLKKVANGMKINGAGDGAAEYSVSEKMRVMIRSLGQDIENAKKGIDLVKIAEKGMQDIIDELRDMKAMAIDSANDHNSEVDRAVLQKEFASRMAGIDNIAATTNYNGKILMDGRYWYKEYEEISGLSSLMNSIKLDKTQSKNFNVVWGMPQLSKSKITFESNSAKNVSSIVEGDVTNLVFDGSASKYKENEITGLFPEAVGITKDAGFGGIEGYSPPYYKYVTKDLNGKYNIYSKTETEYPFADKPLYKINKQYRKIPPIGTEVTTVSTFGSAEYYSAVIKEEIGTGKIIAEANNSTVAMSSENASNRYTGVEIDFANAELNGKKAKIPDDFHGQGFSITRKSYAKTYDGYITSIIFDATLDMGEGILLSSDSPREGTPISIDPVQNEKELEKSYKSLCYSAYIIGIKGANSADDLGTALMNGLKDAQQPWEEHYKNYYNIDDLAEDTAITLPGGRGMFVVKYGSTYALKMLNGQGAGEVRKVITNGVIGMSGTIGKIETLPEPDPPEPDPPEPDPP